MVRINWSKFEEPINLDDTESSIFSSINEAKSEGSSQTDELAFPTDQCIFCARNVTLRIYHPRAEQRPNSLRCHVEN
jgi:hypothetical protein